MNTNSKLLTVKTHSGGFCRMIGMLFGLFAFIWLPTPEVNAELQLKSPPNCGTNDPDPCGPTDKVTVFRWTRNAAAHSYRVIFSEDPDFIGDNILELPEQVPGQVIKKIFAPQVALNLANGNFFFSFTTYYWRVIALDNSGNEVEESPERFAFFYEQDGSGFGVITGIVESDFNQAALVGAQVAVSGAHANSLSGNSVAVTQFNGEYIVIALTTDSNGDPIDFPIKVGATKEGFKLSTVTLQASDKVDGTITRNIQMASIDEPDPVEPEPDVSDSSALPAVLQLLLED